MVCIFIAFSWKSMVTLINLETRIHMCVNKSVVSNASTFSFQKQKLTCKTSEWNSCSHCFLDWGWSWVDSVQCNLQQRDKKKRYKRKCYLRKLKVIFFPKDIYSKTTNRNFLKTVTLQILNTYHLSTAGVQISLVSWQKHHVEVNGKTSWLWCSW